MTKGVIRSEELAYPALIPDAAQDYIRLWAYVRYIETGERQLVMPGLLAWRRYVTGEK